jgi:hypothetical protein
VKRWWIVGVAVGGVLLAACSSSSGSESSKSTPTVTTADARPGSAKITALDIPPSVECQGKTSTSVTIQWATSGAAKRELYIDGRPIADATGVSGTVDTPVHCDPLPHDVVVIAYDDAGRRTSQEKKFVTNA